MSRAFRWSRSSGSAPNGSRNQRRPHSRHSGIRLSARCQMSLPPLNTTKHIPEESAAGETIKKLRKASASPKRIARRICYPLRVRAEKIPPVAKMTAPIGTAIFAEWRMQVYKEGEENSLKKGFQRFCTSWIFASRCRLFSMGAYTAIMASKLGTHSTVKIMPGRKLLLKLCFHTRL